ncbi:MAG: hypothetical protein ACREM1_15450 [Longimicrobiales bacterium]
MALREVVGVSVKDAHVERDLPAVGRDREHVVLARIDAAVSDALRAADEPSDGGFLFR